MMHICYQFSEREWNQIVAPSKARSLQQARMATNFPLDVLDGPQLYNGYTFDHPYFKQGIEKLATLVQEAMNKTKTGTLIKTAAEFLSLELGFDIKIGIIYWKVLKKYLTLT